MGDKNPKKAPKKKGGASAAAAGTAKKKQHMKIPSFYDQEGIFVVFASDSIVYYITKSQE